MLEHGADPRLRNKNGSTPLHDGALSGNAGLIELLESHGADVNATDSESSSTPLHYAASFGRVEAVRILIKLGSNVAAKTSKGFTALQLAERNEHWDVAAMLRDAALGL